MMHITADMIELQLESYVFNNVEFNNVNHDPLQSRNPLITENHNSCGELVYNELG